MRRAGIPRSSTPAGPRTHSAIAARRLRPLALLLCLSASFASSPAQQTTPAPSPTAQLPATPIPQTQGSIAGVVTDADDASIPNARIILTATTPQPSDDSPPQQKAVTALTAGDGSFTVPNIPPGPFTLTVAATGFATRQIAGVLNPSQTLDLSTIVLTASAATEVQVTASQTEIAQAQIGEEEKQRVLGIVPNFYVSYVSDPVPLSPGQKFQLAFKTLVDPVNLVLNGAAAGAQQATDTYAWGEGAQGYAKRYAAAYGNFLTSDMLGNAVFPILFKQDPRYFYKGTGPIHSRILYAMANAVICKGDNRRWQPDYSSILGGLVSGALSNAYYPAVNRTGVGLTFESAGIGTAIAAAANVFQEFLIPKLTPHIPPKAPRNP